MVNALSVDPNKLIEQAAKQLESEKIVSAPDWSSYVKTGSHKERRPVEKNWWFMRSAAILRSVYKLGPIGTSKLRNKYGGRKNRGHKPDKHRDGSGSVARKSLQQLEKAGLLKQVEKGVHKGRIVTPKGKSFLDKIAIQIQKSSKKDES